MGKRYRLSEINRLVGRVSNLPPVHFSLVMCMFLGRLQALAEFRPGISRSTVFASLATALGDRERQMRQVEHRLAYEKVNQPSNFTQDFSI